MVIMDKSERILLFILVFVVFVSSFLIGKKCFPEKEIVIEKEIQTEVITEYIYADRYHSLSDEEFMIAACIVQGEAGIEDFTGKCLVAQCILNACIEDNLTPSEVRKEYQYAGWSEDVSKETIQAVKSVFYDKYEITERPIKYFYAPRYCNGEWHETQTFVLKHGGHKFFEENAPQ